MKRKNRQDGPPGATAKKQAKLQELASRLAPAEEAPEAPQPPTLEELEASAEIDEEYVDGSLILDGDHLDLPRQILPTDDNRASSWANPVLVTVLTFSLAFTALIAYLISLDDG